MKKTMILVAVALALAAGAYIVFAAQSDQPMMGGQMMHGQTSDANQMMMQRGMRRGSMMGRGGMMRSGMMDANDMMMQRGMMGMHPGMMCNTSMAATEDGGVIIMMGTKLMKYDKDLNLVKEVEIKIDWESWTKTMMEHRKMMMEQQKKQ